MKSRTRLMVALVLLLGLTTGGFQPVGAHRPADVSTRYKPGELLVKLRGDVPGELTARLREQVGGVYLRNLYSSPVELWQAPVGQELTVAQRLSADPLVEYAQPNYAYHSTLGPNDPHFSKQWAHTVIQSPAAWDISTGSAGVTIAIIDSGIDEGHPDLAAKIVAGYDFVDGDSNPHDLNGHGTHCAGIAAAIGNNGIGVAGMDWQARIMPIRVLDNEGSGWDSDIADGITWAAQHGAKVLSLSLGGPDYSAALQTAVNNAHTAGCLVVAAMGNDRTDGNPTSYPAAYDNVMAVAATGPTDVYASYSQYGNHCDIAAPGGDMGYLHDPDGIYSTLPTYSVYLNTQYGMYTSYDYLDGTSMATPLAAGLAALVWGAAPTQTPDQVQNVLQTTAVDLGAAGWDVNYGWGRINALAALQAVAGPAAPTLSPISNGDNDGSYLVDWTDVSSATSYTLQEDEQAGFGSPTTRYQGANSQFQVTGQSGGVWYYRVRAANAAGDSAWSTLQSAGVTPAAPALAAITNPSQQDNYLITWAAASSATSYTLQQANNASFSSPTTCYVGTALQYQVTGQAGGAWYYRVRAANSVGSGAWSTTQSTLVAAASLAAPTLSAIANGDGDGAYLVDWSDVTGATSYVLEQCPDPYFAQPTTAYIGAASQLAVTGQSGGRWYYRVRALGAADAHSPWSAAQNVAVITSVYLPVILNRYGTGPVGWQTITTQDFEGTFPGDWNVYDSVAADGLYYWGARNCRPYAGVRSGWAAGAGDGAGLACGSNYPSNMQSWMVYGPFSLADASAADLTFQRWLYSETGYDEFFWGASVNGADFYGWVSSGDSSGWTASTLDLTDVYNLGDLTGQSQVWIALVFASDDSLTYAEGADVDNIVLRKYVGAGAASAAQSAPPGARPATLTRP